MIEVEPGDTVVLGLQLADGDATKFPRAVVRNTAGTPIAGSPFALTHRVGGLYQASFATPAVGEYSVSFATYDDAGFSTESAAHLRVGDVLRVLDTVALSTVMLALQLPDGDAAKFPRARVRNAAGSAIAGSPFALTHVGEGMYTANPTAPSAGEYSASFATYDDAGFSTESASHLRTSDHLSVGNTVGGGGGTTIILQTVEPVVGQIVGVAPLVGTIG